MSFVTRSLDGGIENWTISRPDRRNAIGVTMAEEISQLAHSLLARLQASMMAPSPAILEPLPRALVIRATPCPSREEKSVWIAGGDLKELASLNQSQARHYAHLMTASCSILEQLPIPVVTILEGAAIGGGAEFFLAADIRIATEDSSLEFRQLNVGLCCGYGGTARLVRLCGYGHSQRLLLTGATLDASEAKSLGLIHITSTTSVEAEASCRRLLTSWSELSFQALAAQKQLLVNGWASDASFQTSEQLRLFASVWKNPKHQRFLSRFQS